MTVSLTALTDAGVSIWLDDLSRERLTSGSLAELVAHDHVSGVTTNPSIFAKAISGGTDYEAQLGELAVRGVWVGEALRALTTFDVRWACDVLRPVYEATGGVDGRVSIEVDPRLAHDTAATIAEARALWWAVDRPNLFVKIPAAHQGLEAITACLADGISINITLIFSLTRYEEVMDAFLDGLERARRNGHDLAAIGSVASFFVSRLDSAIDTQLDKIGTADAAALRGQAAIANARLAYQRYERVFSGPRWEALAVRRRARPTAAVGIDVNQGSCLLRHPLRGRLGRRGRRQHDARSHSARGRRSRHRAGRFGARPLRRRATGPRSTGCGRHRLRQRGAGAGRRRRCQVRTGVGSAGREAHDHLADGTRRVPPERGLTRREGTVRRR